MSLIVIVMIVQAVSSTLAWLIFYVVIRASPGARAPHPPWIIAPAVVAAAGLVVVSLLGPSGVSPHNVPPPPPPCAPPPPPPPISPPP